MLCYEREQEVVIAFDQEGDQDKAAIIESYRDRLAEQIRESGMRVHLTRWNTGMGIDDAKTAGAEVEIVPAVL